MQEWEEKILEKRKARAEGLAEGRAEGMAKGRAEGRAKGRAEGNCLQLIQLIKKKILKSKTLVQIADELEENSETIQSLYDCVNQNLDQSNEEIYKIYIASDK